MRVLVDDLYLHICMSREHKGVQLIGVANRNAVLRHLWAFPNDSSKFFDNFNEFVVPMSRSDA